MSNLCIYSYNETHHAECFRIMNCTSNRRPNVYLFSVLQSFLLDFGRSFSFLILYAAGRTPWTGNQSVARPLPTHRTTQTQNKRTQTSMPWVGFEFTIPVFERAKTFHALDRATTMIDLRSNNCQKIDHSHYFTCPSRFSYSKLSCKQF
jgi:hypothetical protein